MHVQSYVNGIKRLTYSLLIMRNKTSTQKKIWPLLSGNYELFMSLLRLTIPLFRFTIPSFSILWLWGVHLVITTSVSRKSYFMVQFGCRTLSNGRNRMFPWYGPTTHYKYGILVTVRFIPLYLSWQHFMYMCACVLACVYMGMHSIYVQWTVNFAMLILAFSLFV